MRSRNRESPAAFLRYVCSSTNRFSVDVNNNYFRGVPTFDERLIGTGLLDKMLFQGWSGGFRLELPVPSAFTPTSAPISERTRVSHP